MLVLINSSVILIMQIIFIYVLMEKRFTKKKTFLILIPSSSIIFAITAMLYLTIGYSFVIKYYLLTIALPLYLILIYLSKNRGFCMIFNILSSGFLETVISLPGYFVTKPFHTYIIVSLVGRLILFPFALLFLIKIFRPLYMQMITKLKKVWALLCLIPLFSYAIIAHLLVYPVNIFDRPENVITLTIAIAIILTAYGVIFVFFRYMTEQFTLQAEQRLLKLQIGTLKNQSNAMRNIEEKNNIMKHDMHHYIQNIYALLKTGNNDTAMDFINTFDNMLKTTNLKNYCENHVINAILTYYFDMAKFEGISITTHLDIPENISINEIELSTVFANAIENACHANQKLPEQSTKSIELICISKPHFILEITNPYTGTIHFDENGFPISKLNGHGIGTQSIIAFCKKNNAIIDYQTDHQMFKFRIMLNKEHLS